LRWSLIVLGLVVILTWTFYPALRIHYQENRERSRLETELESLRERNESLNAQVERLRTPEGVEEAARENLGMVKPGENLYVVVEPEPTATAEASIAPVESETLWVRLLDRVFGVR
jgi:cell division protein FtsL